MRSLAEDVELVQDALDALDVYDRAIAAGEFVPVVPRNRDGLARVLVEVLERGRLDDVDRIALRRHVRIAASGIPGELLPEALPAWSDDPAFPVNLRKARWRAHMDRLDAQTADREAWCALHGVEDPVESISEWVPDQPWEPDDI